MVKRGVKAILFVLPALLAAVLLHIVNLEDCKHFVLFSLIKWKVHSGKVDKPQDVKWLEVRSYHHTYKEVIPPAEGFNNRSCSMREAFLSFVTEGFSAECTPEAAMSGALPAATHSMDTAAASDGAFASNSTKTVRKTHRLTRRFPVARKVGSWLNSKRKLLLAQHQKFNQQQQEQREEALLMSPAAVALQKQRPAQVKLEKEARRRLLEQHQHGSLPEKPNIVLILADDLGMNDLEGCGVTARNINSIRSRTRVPEYKDTLRPRARRTTPSRGSNGGLSFSNAYAGHATCSPSRATMLTGVYAPRFGYEYMPLTTPFAKLIAYTPGNASGGCIISRHCRRSSASNPSCSPHPPVYPAIVNEDPRTVKTNKPFGELALPLNQSTVAEELRFKHGYRTYLLGKWHLGLNEPYTPLHRGFEETLIFPGGGSLYANLTDPTVIKGMVNDSTFDEVIWNLMQFSVSHNNGPLFEPPEYMTDYLSNQAVEVIKGIHDRRRAAKERQQLHKNQNQNHKHPHPHRPHALDHEHEHDHEHDHDWAEGVDDSDIDGDGASDPFFLLLSYNAVHDPFQALISDYDDEEVVSGVQRLVQEAEDRALAIEAQQRGQGQGQGRGVSGPPALLPDSGSRGHGVNGRMTEEDVLIARVHAAMILALDRGVGRVLQALRDTGVYDNTLVIFTSDNGGAANGVFNVNYPYRGWKATLFEGGLRVPMYMQWPAMWGSAAVEGEESEEDLVFPHRVGHVDLYQTLVGAATVHLQGVAGAAGGEKQEAEAADVCTEGTHAAGLGCVVRDVPGGVQRGGINLLPHIQLAVQQHTRTRPNGAVAAPKPNGGRAALALPSLPLPRTALPHIADPPQPAAASPATDAAATAALMEHRPLFYRSGYYKALLLGPYKLQVSSHPGRRDRVWLHNVAHDPAERVDLAPLAMGGGVWGADNATYTGFVKALRETGEGEVGELCADAAVRASLGAALKAVYHATGGGEGTEAYEYRPQHGSALERLIGMEAGGASDGDAEATAAAVVDGVLVRAPPMVTQGLAEVLLHLHRVLLLQDRCVNDAAPAPLWWHVIEAPMGIDKLQGADCLPGDEFVYWSL